MRYLQTLPEEELKIKISKDFFDKFEYKILGKIDFCISKSFDKSNTKDMFEDLLETQSYLWAEAKKGKKADIIESFVQLILTIGKARTFEYYLPPLFLGAFDCEKIAFIEYDKIQEIFNQNDFNWNVTPSNHETKEFKQLYELVKTTLDENKFLFNFKEDDKELKNFIENNFKFGDKRKQYTTKIQITKNNFTTVYLKWLKKVKPTISIDWEKVKNNRIIDADFYLADLLSKDNESIKDNLFVILVKDKYEFNKKIDELGLFSNNKAYFIDDQKAYNEFWTLYERPPKKEFWNYIIERRDLLVPQDIREIKGSFFTPQQWVEKSQEYLANVLGENWQDEYYIWDCCAGTGNLLNGLTNKYNIYASTLDKADIDVIKDRIKNGANLLESHIFQMDFLNDNFEDKCPQELLNIIKDPEKRKKLVIYINPPYVEASNMKTTTGTGKSRDGVATQTKLYKKINQIIGTGARELFVQFFFRIYQEIPDCILAEFSTLKILQAQNFEKFRQVFKAKLEKIFIIPANTFDNVKGQFPIGFMIWNLNKKEVFKEIVANVYGKDNNFIENKKIVSVEKNKYIINWLRTFYDKENQRISYLRMIGTDFQHNEGVFVTNKPSDNDLKKKLTTNITKNNIIPIFIYLSVRQCIPTTWINNCDQFLYPNDSWKEDKKFQSNCLVYTLFNGHNKIKSSEGINNFIPFTEKEVNAKDNFESHFITDYIRENKIIFSKEAQDVLLAGKELFKYYHSKENSNPNASFYDIKEYFQGRNDKGRMNTNSDDLIYTNLLTNLKEKQKILAKKISQKIYEYGFLI